MSRDATPYVDDMIEACRRVLQYSDGLERAQLVSGTMPHDAVLRNLEVLGEAAKNVPSHMRGLDDQIPGVGSPGCVTYWRTATSA